jgi:hypothetical protein
LRGEPIAEEKCTQRRLGLFLAGCLGIVPLAWMNSVADRACRLAALWWMALSASLR